MINRKKFIKGFAAAGVAAMIGPSFLISGDRMKLKNIGFISGILEKEMKEDWKGALKKAASFGYTELETGGFMGSSPGEFLKFCKDIGLIPVAGFINFTGKDDEIKKNIDLIHELEMKFAVTYWPWLTGGPFSLDDCKRSSERLNYLGDICTRNRLTFCWHNHNKEFIKMETGLPFDYLMKNTDPKNVRCELDIYWVKKGGDDPLEKLKKYRGRYSILHIKDMAPGPEQDFACPGSGVIDFRPILSEAEDQKIGHYMVERDNVTDGLECLRTSSEYLRSIRF